MSFTKEENNWNIKSLYDLQYFNCPSCPYKNNLKQEFVNHAHIFHPESNKYLRNIADDSISDVYIPSTNSTEIKELDPIKEEHIISDENVDQNFSHTNSVVLMENFKKEDYYCDLCDLYLCNQNSFQEHQESVHYIKYDHVDENFHIDHVEDFYDETKNILSDNAQVFKCESCSKSFSMQHNLKRHIQITHEGHRDYKCESCGKSFTRSHHLKQHIHTIHEGLKDYECESCGMSFSQSHSLKQHIHTIHEGRKDYKCESCGKSFTGAQYLKKHIYIVHEGHKDHKCDYCGKSFSQGGYLKKHIHTVHEGSRDYRCDSCGKSFSQAENLKRHVHTVHDGHKDYKCESCRKSFTTIFTFLIFSAFMNCMDVFL